MLALMDALGLQQAGIVGHDVGGALMQPLARQAPGRISGLFFFDFVYPGIGARMAEPERLNNIWYQSFHQMEMAPRLIGASRENCGLYIGHFLKSWSHRKHAFDDVRDAFTDNFMKPGNLAGGFAHYRAAHAGRIRMMKGEASTLAPIALPTCVRWAEHDPLFPYAWTDRLGETFSNLDLAMFEGVGHFAHREDPDRAASEIAAFFKRIGWSRPSEEVIRIRLLCPSRPSEEAIYVCLPCPPQISEEVIHVYLPCSPRPSVKVIRVRLSHPQKLTEEADRA